MSQLITRNEVEDLCERVVIIDHGRLVAHGTVDELEMSGPQRLVVRIEGDRSGDWARRLAGVSVSEVYPSRLPDLFSAKPVIVTGPAEPDEFAHHPRFKALIDRGAIVLVPRNAGEDVYADKIVSTLKSKPAAAPFEFDGWWRDAVQAIRAQFTP